MAQSNKWQEEKALCPNCRRPFGEWREGETHLLGVSLVLPYVTTVRCTHEDCGEEFTVRPRTTPPKPSVVAVSALDVGCVVH